MKHILAIASLASVLLAGSSAYAYKFDVPGGVCPKDPKIMCGIRCDNGQTADYMKWTGSGWSDLIGRIKDPDMNNEAKKIIANSNKLNAGIGAPADCK